MQMYRRDQMAQTMTSLAPCSIVVCEEMNNPVEQTRASMHTQYVLHHLPTELVITMEYVKGAAVCDKDALQRMGVKHSDAAKLVLEIFTEMIFTFGDVSLLPCPSARVPCINKKQPWMAACSFGSVVV